MFQRRPHTQRTRFTRFLDRLVYYYASSGIFRPTGPNDKMVKETKYYELLGVGLSELCLYLY